MSIKIYELAYDRKSITPGILHFGVGNFHRAHQAYYTNLLLTYPDQKNWGICGAMILEKDEYVFRRLKKQDCCYGLTVYGRSGKDEYYRIGSIVELFWGIENPTAIIDKVADTSTKIITLTITEGGYNLDKKTRKFDFSNENILYDLKLPEKPRTVFGYVAAGLRKRMAANAGPVTILSCDNLPHNGDVCRDSFMSFFEKADMQLYNWAKNNVSFPNSMVDRITPATLEEDIPKLYAKNGHEDLVPVYCEDFVQWVIEDKFLAGRPAWERAGVEFTDDVSKYEAMKLGIVNSTHQMLSFPAFFAGYRRVDEAVADERIATYLRQYMDLDVTPYLSPPPNTDLEVYKTTFMERLKNKEVSDQLSRLCFDAANKIPVFMIPTLKAMLEANADMKRIAFLVAAYRLYLRSDKDERGVSYKIDDPGLLETDQILINSGNPLDFIGLSCFSGVNLGSSNNFIEWYLKYCNDIESKGVLSTMEELIGEL
ncbi:MAG TPA: mannitol dehydrogenase family protein [Clostridiaceae bacterium]|nr:mannitol dehydrogenase family protein [Clostridiaceae bacterium]